MFADFDWCNIYHVCIGNRDNIFLCPPGTVFNDTKQGCTDRFSGSNCNGTRAYYKPATKREKRVELPSSVRKPSRPSHPIPDYAESGLIDDEQPRIPSEWRNMPHLQQVDHIIR